MPITLPDVLRKLDVDEPNYAALAALGPEALPHLATLVSGEDAGVASKAAYLASLIQSDEALPIIEAAAASPHDTVRVAVAAGLRHAEGSQTAAVTGRLLTDADAGVRKQALRTAESRSFTGLDPHVRSIAASDAQPELRRMAAAQLGDRRQPPVEGAGAATKRARRAPAKKGKKK